MGERLLKSYTKSLLQVAIAAKKVVPQACESYADLHTVLWSCFLTVQLMAINQSIGMQFEMTQWTRQQKDVGKLC